MKVLQVINSLQAGGAERLLADLLPALTKAGINCEVLALDGRNDAFSAGLRAEGVGVEFLCPEGGSPYSPLRLLGIFKAIRKSGADLVHVHLAPSLYWVALVSFILKGRPLAVTEHASFHRRMGKALLRPIERALYSRFDRIVCVSVDTKVAVASWLGRDLSDPAMVVIGNGIPLERFAARAIPAKDVQDWLGPRRGIAMTARLVLAKDHPTALRALARLPEEFALVLVGGGPEEIALRSLCAELGLQGRCLFAGVRTDVPEILAACEIYLQSSNNEGFGIAALEAMAASLPVVASEVDGLGALVGGAGLLFPPGDNRACAAAILKVATDKALADRLVAAGVARSAGYGIDVTAQAYEQIYRGLVEGLEKA